MESYFYCSYENSKTGFFHTRLEGDALVPVEGGHEGLPAALGEFFSYGIFRLLWRDLAEPVEKPWRQPMPTAGMFGLRELEGSFSDGRQGTVNLAFYAAPGEGSRLRRTALAILGDFDQVLSLSLVPKAAAERERQAAQAQTATAGGITIQGEGDPAIDALVLQRAQAKKAKDFAAADRIRDELRQQGIEVTDVPGGAVWKRV